MSKQFPTYEVVPIGAIRPNPDNPRRHSKKQRRQIARSMQKFGVTNPVIVDENGMLIAGHGRYEAALELGLESLPVIKVEGLSDHEKHGLMIADNKLAENSSWDDDKLDRLLASLAEINFDFEDIGIDTAEADKRLIRKEDGSIVDGADVFEEPLRSKPSIARSGDLFVIGDRHFLLCADSMLASSYELVLDGRKCAASFNDPPYNVPTKGHISTSSNAWHPSFMMAAGEMSEDEFISFLRTIIVLLRRFSVDGALHYISMDWKHLFELLSAAKYVLELKNLCVWAKDNGGMGSLYRSQHEHVAVFKGGKAAHTNNVQLGRFGRNRSNIWQYPGVNTMRAGRLADLKAHPTVKPVALVADAILDSTSIGGLVLDAFAGSGTTILACERTRRLAAAIEIDPYYVDTAITRIRERAGLEAVHRQTGMTFDELSAARREDRS